MAQLVEIIFEDVTAETASTLCTALLGPTVAKVLFNQLGSQEDGVTEKPVGELGLSAGGTIHGSHLRLLRYEGAHLDVELNFYLDEVRGLRGTALQKALCDLATRLAEEAGVANYFGGIEPASDEETRLFTGTTLGPLRLRE